MKAFVGCSSSCELDDIYYKEASLVSECLVDLGYELLIGGNVGVMKVVTDAFSSKRASIKIMEADCYRQDNYIYDVIHHKSISLRKEELINSADLILFMPGGIGTLDEMFSAIESKRAREINKDIIIYNIDNYYDNLLEMLDKMYNKKFANVSAKKLYKVIDNIVDLKIYLEGIGK